MSSPISESPSDVATAPIRRTDPGVTEIASRSLASFVHHSLDEQLQILVETLAQVDRFGDFPAVSTPASYRSAHRRNDPQARASAIEGWRGPLSDGADLLFYGGDLAEMGKGQVS